MKTKSYFAEILNSYPRKKIKPYEIFHSFWEDSYVFIERGKIAAIRHEETLSTYYPVLFESGDFLGPLKMLIDGYTSRGWELIALEESQVIFFPVDELEKNPDFKIYFYENGFKSFNFARNAYYIWGRGGAKSYLAFLLSAYSEMSFVSKDKLDTLSKMLGVNRSVYLRIIKSFISMGILKQRKNGVFIVDFLELKKLYLEYDHSSIH